MAVPADDALHITRLIKSSVIRSRYFRSIGFLKSEVYRHLVDEAVGFLVIALFGSPRMVQDPYGREILVAEKPV